MAAQTPSVRANMTAPDPATRQRYQSWVEDQLEDFKAGLAREELLDLAEEAVNRLYDSPDGQYPLTEILLCDAVDALLFDRLSLPDFRQWRRMCRSDTNGRHRKGTTGEALAAS
jgi:hypothetical protein